MAMFIDSPDPGPSTPPPAAQMATSSTSLKQYQFQFYPGCSPGTLMGPLDFPDLHNLQSSSMTSSSSIASSLLLHKLGTMASSNSICKDYTCCGLTLHDLHALVEHFEECHVVVVDDDQQPQTSQQQPQQEQQQSQTTVASGSLTAPTPATQTSQPKLEEEGEIDIDTLDDMDISDSEESDSPSPPSPVHSSGYSTPSISPPLTPVMAFDTITTSRHQRFLGGVGALGIDVSLAAGAFNSYGGLVASKPQPPQLQTRKLSCLPPSLLTTPTNSRASSPYPHPPPTGATSTPVHTPTTPIPTAAYPFPNVPTPAKPFPCPNPSCSKAYKQSNGLKYHLTHGSCSYNPSAASKQEDRPFECKIPICERRYKNMNGLRYHYAHTGHGGVELMARPVAPPTQAKTTPTSVQGEIKKIRLVPHHQFQQQQQRRNEEDVIMS